MYQVTALRLLRREDPKWLYAEVRSGKHLNDIVEESHRAIKRHCASMTGLKSFANTSITISGIESTSLSSPLDPVAVDAANPSSTNGSEHWRKALRGTRKETSTFRPADAPELAAVIGCLAADKGHSVVDRSAAAARVGLDADDVAHCVSFPLAGAICIEIHWPTAPSSPRVTGLIGGLMR